MEPDWRDRAEARREVLREAGGQSTIFNDKMHDEELDGLEKHLRWASTLDRHEPLVGADSPVTHWCLWSQCMVRNLWQGEQEADYWVVEHPSNVGSQRSACFRRCRIASTTRTKDELRKATTMRPRKPRQEPFKPESSPRSRLTPEHSAQDDLR